MDGESFALGFLTIFDVVFGNHYELAAVILHNERELGALLRRAHWIHDSRVGELNGSLRQCLDVEVGAGKLDAGHVPAVAI